MNINNNKQTVQQRVQAIEKGQQTAPINKEIQTGLDKQTFAQRRSQFEKGSPSTGQTLDSSKNLEQITGLIDNRTPEDIHKTSNELSKINTQIGQNLNPNQSAHTTQSVEINGHSYLVNLENQTVDVEGSAYGYTVTENDNEIMIDGNLYLTTTTPYESVSNYGYTSGYSPSQDEPVTQELSPEGYRKLAKPEEQESQSTGKYETVSNHHQVTERYESNVDGIERGDEFAIRGSSNYTAMFASTESQNDNKLNFSEQGVKRGQDENLLSTQSKSKGMWSGSKSNRMIFVMDPNGGIFAIDPSKPIQHNGATVMDVRLHHSSLLNGGDVSGAGEIQVSSGLSEADMNHLTQVVTQKVQQKIQKEGLTGEAAESFFKFTLNQELSRILKNFEPGQVEVISDRSGHYRPDLQKTAQVIEELQQQGVDVNRVNVELGDKTGELKALEGELMVPTSAVLASKDLGDGEVQLRNQNARKMNVHQELLGKFGKTSEKAETQKQNLGQLLNQHLRNEDYDKAAVIYERLQLLLGVEVNPQKVGKNLERKQEKSIKGDIMTDSSIPLKHRAELKDAYKEMLSERNEQRLENKQTTAPELGGYVDENGNSIPDLNYSLVSKPILDKDGNQTGYSELPDWVKE